MLAVLQMISVCFFAWNLSGLLLACACPQNELPALAWRRSTSSARHFDQDEDWAGKYGCHACPHITCGASLLNLLCARAIAGVQSRYGSTTLHYALERAPGQTKVSIERIAALQAR